MMPQRLGTHKDNLCFWTDISDTLDMGSCAVVVGGSVVVLNWEEWERPTLTTFNKCRNLMLLSFLPPIILEEREKYGNSVPMRSPSTIALVGGNTKIVAISIRR